jgi:hypothetical protein
MMQATQSGNGEPRVAFREKILPAGRLSILTVSGGVRAF